MGVLNYENDRISGEARFLDQFLTRRKSCVVFDIGANVGNYTQRVLEAQPGARVFAFEPHPATFQRLSENLHNPNITLVNAAAGESDGVLKLYDYAAQDGSSHASAYREVIESIHHAASTHHRVPVHALGDYARVQGVDHIDLLKIDTEGHELSVLKGIQTYLEAGKIDAIHFEFNEMNVASRVFFRDFIELLPNYELYRLLPDGAVKIAHYVPFQCELFAYQNIVAYLKTA